MGIISHLYNQRFNIYRNQKVASDMYELSAASRVLVSTNISGRIVRGKINEPSREGAIKDMGMGSAFIYKLFVPTIVDIQVGDFIVQIGNRSNSFMVDHVNKYPGGESGHHTECDITSTTYIAS